MDTLDVAAFGLGDNLGALSLDDGIAAAETAISTRAGGAYTLLSATEEEGDGVDGLTLGQGQEGSEMLAEAAPAGSSLLSATQTYDDAADFDAEGAEGSEA